MKHTDVVFRTLVRGVFALLVFTQPAFALECATAGTPPTASPDDGGNGGATACGDGAVAGGNFSMAMGYQTTATGNIATALGRSASANGYSSIALGVNTVSGGDYGTAMGFAANAAGSSSTALGRGTAAVGEFSTALGYSAAANGPSSVALGRGAAAGGEVSIALGYFAAAGGLNSAALGRGSIAGGPNSIALGHEASAGGDSSTALGFRASAPNPNTVVLGSIPGVIGGTAYADIGVGTNAPTQAVDVERSGAAARFQVTSYTSMSAEAPQFIQRRSRGTRTTPSAIKYNDNLGLFSFRGFDGSQMTGSRAAITVQAAGDWNANSNPTRILFGTTPVGSTVTQSVLEITAEGTVKINGSSLNVPDYVFEDDYALMPLEELRAFIDANGHLPGIASASEVNANGLDLAGAQMGQLQKIEELTLYTLQQEQRLSALDAENRALREELAALRAGLDEVRRLNGLD